MKRIILALLALVCMAGTAHAALWEFTATSKDSSYSDFTIMFQAAESGGTVTISDVVSFSGVYITNSGITRYYDQLVNLTGVSVVGLTLTDSDDDHWRFHGATGYRQPHEILWSYSANVATPIPGAAWLLGTGVLGLFGLRRNFL